MILGSLSAQESTQNQEEFLIKANTVTSDVEPLELNMVKYFEGKVFLNGELSNTKVISQLDVAKIETIEIFKGEAAKAKFDLDQPVLVVETKL